VKASSPYPNILLILVATLLDIPPLIYFGFGSCSCSGGYLVLVIIFVNFEVEMANKSLFLVYSFIVRHSPS